MAVTASVRAAHMTAAPLFRAEASRPAMGRSHLALSLALHVMVAVALLSIRGLVEIPLAATAAHVTLIAPLTRLPRRAVERPAPRQAARAFRAPVEHPMGSSMPPAPRLVAPVELPVEIAAELPTAQLPRLVAGPPIRTGMLDEARPAAPMAASRVAARASGFGAADHLEETPAAIAKPAARTGEFGDAEAAPAASRVAQSAAGGASSGVEILSKPRPPYTAEARRLRLEGEVLLEVLFRASGEIQVLRMVRGLGYGLDESAAEAARQIRFRPARREGVPVDATAIVHISFELAF